MGSISQQRAINRSTSQPERAKRSKGESVMDSIIKSYLKGVSLGSPVSHGSMTVVPIFAPPVTEEYEYLTLSEAMCLGVLHINEVSDAGHVPELMAVNTGIKRSLFLTVNSSWARNKIAL